MSILQWNIQSIRTKFNELKILLSELNPCCVCLQETMLGDNQMNPPSGYVMLQSRRVRDIIYYYESEVLHLTRA